MFFSVPCVSQYTLNVLNAFYLCSSILATVGRPTGRHFIAWDFGQKLTAKVAGQSCHCVTTSAG